MFRIFFFVLCLLGLAGGLFFVIGKVSETNDSDVPTSTASGTGSVVVDTRDAVVEGVIEKIPAEGIPLASLQLSPTQKSTLAALKIDVATFVITPTMLACAKESLGAPRLEVIIKGEAPTVLEMAKLVPCLSKGSG